MVLGALMLVRSPLTGMGVSLGAALGVTIPCALIMIFLMRLVMQSRQWKHSTGREQLVGEIGRSDGAGAGAGDGAGELFVHGGTMAGRGARPRFRAGRMRACAESAEGLTLHVGAGGRRRACGASTGQLMALRIEEDAMGFWNSRYCCLGCAYFDFSDLAVQFCLRDQGMGTRRGSAPRERCGRIRSRPDCSWFFGRSTC